MIDWTVARRCSACREAKALAFFSPSCLRANGRTGRCKLCENARAAKYYTKTARVKPVTEPTPTTKYYPATQAKWERANRHKRAAHAAVRNAKKALKLLPQPCQVCGSLDVEAHHESYAREDRLKVTWFCTKHHHNAHNVEVRAGGVEVVAKTVG